MGLAFSAMMDEYKLFDINTRDYNDPNIDAIILNEMEKGQLDNFYIKYHENLNNNKGDNNG